MAAMARSLRALHWLLESHSSDARCQSAAQTGFFGFKHSCKNAGQRTRPQGNCTGSSDTSKHTGRVKQPRRSAPPRALLAALCLHGLVVASLSCCLGAAALRRPTKVTFLIDTADCLPATIPQSPFLPRRTLLLSGSTHL